MFGFLKTYIRKLVAETPAENPELSAPEPAPAARPFGASASTAAPAPSAAPLQRNSNGGPQNGKGFQLPLQIILNTLPLELQSKVRHPDVGDRMIGVPLEKVLAQLSRGSVAITFGELRHAAPDVFAAEIDRDKVLVPLPLSEIVSRLNPNLITRRRVQRTVEVPDEISSPFDPKGQGLIFSIGPSKAEAATAPVSAPRQIQPASTPATVAPGRGSMTSSPTPPAPAAAPAGAPAMISATRALRELSTPPPAAASAKSAGEPARIAMIKPAGDKERLSMVKPGGDTERLAIAAKTAASSEAARPEVELPTLLVALTALAEAWPEPVRKEIVEANLVDAKVALPHDSVKQALKQGRIAFSWKALRSWITSPVSPLSPHDSLVLELPLRVVAPLFLARQQEDQKAQHKVSVDVEIPNLFFGFPQSESGANPQVGGDAPPQVAGRSSDTNYYVWDDSSDVARVDSSAEKRAPTPGTKFVAKYATPNEVVSRAAALEGVAGSLIALPDGLMVANQVPSELNADTIAAFLPQIFGKVSACTKELRMGDLNNLNFTVGNVPWKIFRVNAIFFAAFGRPGQPLPTAELASLAGELDHKPK